MNILYFCVEYYQAFGPSTHAREFFAELQNLPGVGVCKVVPEKDDSDAVTHIPVKASEASLKRKLARILVPRWVRLIGLFLRPPEAAWAVLQGELASKKWDALVMRPGWALMWVPKLKKAFPDVQILLEINSAMFDEGFKEVPFKGFWKKVEARAINSADLVTTVSENLKEYLIKQGVDPNKIQVNPNGVNLAQFASEKFTAETGNNVRDEFGIPRDSTLFGYVGGMQPFRHLSDVVASFAELLETHHLNASLLLIGDGTDMDMISEVRSSVSRAVQERIIIAGSKSYDEIPRIMSAFDVAIFPFSNPYGSPQKLFEYMAMGIPVIGPKVPVVEETFREGEHLLLVEQNNVASFKESVLRCMEKPPSLDIMAKSGQAYVMQKYTWQKNAERVFALLAQNA